MRLTGALLILLAGLAFGWPVAGLAFGWPVAFYLLVGLLVVSACLEVWTS